MECHAGGSRSIPTVHQRRQRREAVGCPRRLTKPPNTTMKTTRLRDCVERLSHHLQGHSGRNLIDPSFQDHVLIPDDFFKYFYHVGCSTNLHSFVNSGLTSGGQNLSNRQTVFSLLVDLMNKDTRILIRSTWEHRVMHNTCIKHGRNIRTRCTGSTSHLLRKERIKVLSNANERHHPLQYTPSLLFPEGYQDGNWRNFARTIFESHRPLPKISLRNDWIPIRSTGQPVVTEQTSQEIETRFSRDCENTNLFVERLEKDKDVDADRDKTLVTPASEHLNCHNQL